MTQFKYLIIGGGVAGTTAAETIRQNDPVGSIAIVSDEPYFFYSRIMLSKPNFFLGKIPFEQIWLKNENWYRENKIEFLGGKKATQLNTAQKIITLNTGEQIQYEKLLLAIGGYARQWPIAGADKEGIYYLRNLDQAKKLIASVKTAKQAIAVGSGFISFEMCEMMRLAGLEVTLVMREPYYWYPLLDEDSGKIIEQALEKGGVKILPNSEVAQILGDKKLEGVILKDGTKIDCQLAVVGIGLQCELEWLKQAGLQTNRGILANEYLETNIPDIFTAGDIAEFQDLVLGEKVQLGNWVNAQMQGRIAALNMLGKKQPFKMVSFYTTQGFGINIAFSGDVRVDETRKVIKRGSPEINSYVRLIIDQNNEIIGATFINRTQEIAAVNKLIETDFKVEGYEAKLADPNFDLKTLVTP
jgi:NAD(P)H-nitrite reductase large subunit